MSEKKYNLGDIYVDGFEPTKEYKELAKKEKEGTVKQEDYKILNKPYVAKE